MKGGENQKEVNSEIKGELMGQEFKGKKKKYLKMKGGKGNEFKEDRCL